MKNRPNQTSRAGRQIPLDHLKPGGRPRTAEDAQDKGPTIEALRARGGAEPAEAAVPAQAAEAAVPAQPAEPATPGAGDSDAVRGKSTRSPAAVAQRPHLEGSEQGPA